MRMHSFPSTQERPTYLQHHLMMITGTSAGEPRYLHLTRPKTYNASAIASLDSWGWGSPWREYREFVGQIDFGAIYQLWRPELHTRFGDRFQEVTHTLLACQRRRESPVSMLPDECIMYILNMCKNPKATPNTSSTVNCVV